MSKEAKSLLNQIRTRRPGNGNEGYAVYGHPLMGPVMVGHPSTHGALNEMLELYIAARESEDQANLRAKLEEMTEKWRTAEKKRTENLKELSELKRELPAAQNQAKQRLTFIRNLLRIGDIIALKDNYRTYRRIIDDIDHTLEDADVVIHYREWDERRSDWCKTTKSEALPSFFHPRLVCVQIQSPGDKTYPTPKQTKAKSKRK